MRICFFLDESLISIFRFFFGCQAFPLIPLQQERQPQASTHVLVWTFFSPSFYIRFFSHGPGTRVDRSFQSCSPLNCHNSRWPATSRTGCVWKWTVDVSGYFLFQILHQKIPRFCFWTGCFLRRSERRLWFEHGFLFPDGEMLEMCNPCNPSTCDMGESDGPASTCFDCLAAGSIGHPELCRQPFCCWSLDWKHISRSERSSGPNGLPFYRLFFRVFVAKVVWRASIFLTAWKSTLILVTRWDFGSEDFQSQPWALEFGSHNINILGNMYMSNCQASVLLFRLVPNIFDRQFSPWRIWLESWGKRLLREWCELWLLSSSTWRACLVT